MELIKRVRPMWVAFIILICKGFKMIISLHENKYKVSELAVLLRERLLVDGGKRP